MNREDFLVYGDFCGDTIRVSLIWFCIKDIDFKKKEVEFTAIGCDKWDQEKCDAMKNSIIEMVTPGIDHIIRTYEKTSSAQ